MSEDASHPARCAILVPAFEEAERVAQVVQAARTARLGPVLVIDDGSRDATGAAAREAGARVLRLERNLGKGGALAAGMVACEAEVLVLLDADLTGLRPEHVRALAAPVLAGEADMTRGVFQGARFRTTAAQRLAPQLGGQRGIRRALLRRVEGLSASRYGVEMLLAEAARKSGWRVLDVPLSDVSQVMKEEKLGWWRGVRARMGMYRDIFRAWWARRA